MTRFVSLLGDRDDISSRNADMRNVDDVPSSLLLLAIVAGLLILLLPPRTHLREVISYGAVRTGRPSLALLVLASEPHTAERLCKRRG